MNRSDFDAAMAFYAPDDSDRRQAELHYAEWLADETARKEYEMWLDDLFRTVYGEKW